MSEITGHSGELAVHVARAHGVETMFTLSGAHVFPMYDGAVKAEPQMRLLDVRHEQTAAFAAEATGKLTRVPGLAVLTAGPGVTNGISAIAQAQFAGSPMVVVGGRAPQNRWGTGSLQELDQLLIIAPVAKAASTIMTAGDVVVGVDEADPGPPSSPWPGLRRRADGRVLQLGRPAPSAGRGTRIEPDGDAIAHRRPARAGAASRPHPRHRRVGRPRGVGRTALRRGPRHPDAHQRHGPRCHPRRAPLAGHQGPRCGPVRGRPGGRRGHPPRLPPRLRRLRRPGQDPTGEFARVVHIADSPGQVSGHAELAASVAGDLTTILDGLQRAIEGGDKPDWRAWADQLRDQVKAAAERDAQLLTAEADPIHPARIYGELVPRLEDDSVVIGDGGDFVSFAGKYVEPKRPGGWLDPGPYGCLGAGLGAAIAARIARPSARSRSSSATAPPASR